MKILKQILLVLLSLFVVFVVIIAIIQIHHRKCEQIDFVMHYSGLTPSVSKEELLAKLKDAKIKIINQERKDIKEEEIVTCLKKHPYIKQIISIRFSGKTLWIDIILRDLLIQIFPLQGETFFIDKDGFLLPYNALVRERLLIANGNISDNYKQGMNIERGSKTLQSIFEVAQIINQKGFFKAQLKQLFVNQEQEIEISPALGKQMILLGKGENVEEKLLHLEQFYKQAFLYLNSDNYVQLDLRFKNRVIAKRNY